MRKYLLFTIVVFHVSIGANLSSAQTKSRLDLFYGDQVLDAHNSPNYKNPGEDFTLDYYGSGDADWNDTLDIRDYNFIKSGAKNDRTDVDGDGITSSFDLSLLDKYLTKQIKYLPAHWDLLRTNGERESWFLKMIAIDQTDKKTKTPNYDYDEYAMEVNLTSTGIEKVGGSGLDFSVIDTSRNMRFNIPVYRISTRTTKDSAHRIVGVLTGDDIANFDDWYFVEPQDDSKVAPGDYSMHESRPVGIDRLVYMYDNDLQTYTYSNFAILNFNLNKGINWVSFKHPEAIEKRTLIPIRFNEVDLPKDTTIDYGYPTDTSVTGVPKNLYKNARFVYTDTSTQKFDNSIDQINYEIFRTFKVINHQLIDTTFSPQIIKIRDTEIPVITVPNNVIVTYGSSLKPSSTGEPTFVDNSNLPVFWIHTDSSTRSPDSLNCNHYNYKLFRTFYGTDIAGNSVSEVQEITVQKPNSLVFTYFPSDTTVINNSNISPDSIKCWPIANDNLVSWYVPNLSFSDEILDSTATKKSVKRTFTARGICLTDEIEGSQNINSILSGIEQREYWNSFKIFPNPSDGHITLEFDKLDLYQITVFSLGGKLVLELSDSFERSRTLYLENPAMYVVKITNSVGETSRRLVQIR